MAWLHRDAMLAALDREVDALGIEGGLSDAERGRRTAELRERLSSLERAEEGAIVAAAEAGQDIPRRADASPLAVLGVRIVDAREMAA